MGRVNGGCAMGEGEGCVREAVVGGEHAREGGGERKEGREA